MVFNSYIKIVQMDAMNDLLTDYRMQSIKHKGNKKSRDPNKSLCFLYSFILHLRMCNASQADHANGCSSRYSYVLHNHQ